MQTMSHCLINAITTFGKYLIGKLPSKLPLFISGYSEGGHLAAWYFYCLDSPEEEVCTSVPRLQEYELRKVASLEGPLDLQNVTIPFLLEHIPCEARTNFHGFGIL